MDLHPSTPDNDDFGPIPVTEDRLRHLWHLVHSQSRLQKAGYVLWPLSRSDMDKKKRCESCSKVIRHGHEKQQSTSLSIKKLAPTMAQQIAAGDFDSLVDDDQQSATAPLPLQARPPSPQQTAAATAATADEISDMLQATALSSDTKRPQRRPMGCKYHPGIISSFELTNDHGRLLSQTRRQIKQLWSCCQRGPSSPPCATRQYHTSRTYQPGELESNWQYFATPPHEAEAQADAGVGAGAEALNHFAATTPPAAFATKSKSSGRSQTCPAPAAVIVVDCEMGVAQSGESELIRVSAVDFFTREVLVDSLVWPDVKMAHFNTRFSGVSRQSMDQARRAFRALPGRAGARQALWRVVGPRTIVVGHAAKEDLNALRWIHSFIIDTLLLEMRIQPPPSPPLLPSCRPDNDIDAAASPSHSSASAAAAAAAAAAADAPAADAAHNPLPSYHDPAATPTREAPLVVLANDHGRLSPQPGDESKPNPKPFRGLSLKALAAQRLKREIQPKGQGHDSIQDALATRDLLLWHLIHKPEPPLSSTNVL